MIDDANASIAQAPQRAPVSIIERLIPSLSFGLAAISGGIGAMMIQKFFSDLRNTENSGLDSLYIGLARIDAVIGGILAAAALLGMVGLLICLIRMFSANSKSSPPGILFLLIGLLSLLPCFLVGIGIYLVIRSLFGPGVPNLSIVGSVVSFLTFSSIVVACLMILVLGAFSFVSFLSRPGRKYSPFVFLLLIEIGEICSSAAFFSVVKYCLSNTSASFWR